MASASGIFTNPNNVFRQPKAPKAKGKTRNNKHIAPKNRPTRNKKRTNKGKNYNETKKNKSIKKAKAATMRSQRAAAADEVKNLANLFRNTKI